MIWPVIGYTAVAMLYLLVGAISAGVYVELCRTEWESEPKKFWMVANFFVWPLVALGGFCIFVGAVMVEVAETLVQAWRK